MKYTIIDFDERYFIGIEYQGGISPNSNPQIGSFWSDFLEEDIKLIIDIPNHNKFIGLECYPPDFKESRVFDYYALLQTKELSKRDGFVSKKLPKGKYISFEVEFDEIHDEIQRVYRFIKSEGINIHFGFDYEDYLQTEDYTKEGAKINFVLKLEE